MSAASLSLLKGGAKGAVDTELEDPVPATPANDTSDATDEVVNIDVDTMDNAALDAMVMEYEIETPAGWSKLGAEEKRSWLKEQFEEADETPPEPEPEPEPEPKPVAAKKAAKTKPALVPVEQNHPDEVQTLPPATEDAQPAPEPVSPTTAVATKTVTKSVTKTTAKTGTITSKGDDVLSDLVHEIETLKEKQARDLVKSLSEETDITFFRLGGVLSVIQANGWYEPYASFREFVEKEHGLHYRKATYWVGIYNSLAESKVPWAKVSDLGWTKLKEIAAVITIENVDEWVKIAKAQNTLSLIDTVKAHLAKDAPKALEDGTSKTVTTKTFKVHDGQKQVIEAALAKAKNDGNTVVDTVALEYICSDFLASQTMAQKLKAMGIEAALEALEKAYPTAKIEVEITEDDTAAA